MNIRKTLVAATALVAATSLVACSSNSSDSTGETAASGENTTIRIGTTDATQKSWAVLEDLAAENGITLDVVNYSDYNTPNEALDQGQLDVNLFQHLKFLAAYNVGKDATLTPVGATQIVPLALFWKDHTSLDGIEGESIVIPNDDSNQGRAINVLVQAGLVTLKEEGLVTPTPADIDEAASKVTITPVDAAQTTVAYGEGRPAIINNSFLDRAGIDPNLAVFQDDPASAEAEPYINAFVTTADRANDPTILKLAELWHDPAVLAAVDEDSKGTAIPVTRTQDELKAILARLEEDARS
ncbi:MetQ/NlpA family ABC transporter substrate-binding protein [Corynebacterium sp. 153RC1]|uniref:MetQ/NlpA family ABC transporter substrate-binding protein n=1 Tax=Corynebacterium TaxID=1716 RepID=UPI00211C3054|nr:MULTISPECIES: MetQ/NlpA family ABC transporter substrate-binding protein [unclassified Corynebacterium]MCQ9369970.1 MetQ/NlpA family ABC transporter substrate-binding protein [Corynebacterium sp. 35RC1]MCQ9343174.1 MetQ/NlpA family ABC transporter substrate-binding protein [Corynebacterium sp. 76QC2CO]MCQ9352187.1 MetQ/NlpA family ABC transporter substrate-binding protein [Corynebacterium sp. 209RC1]MCQ9354190.1 MetQ/NlpA family ABC transporter substrate-binding protein [Corynebacterium sp. 